LGHRDTGEREAARYTKGDIISVQIGTYDVSRAASPHAPGWSRYSAQDISVMHDVLYLHGPHRVVPLDRGKCKVACDAYPYVIFFKNFTMVHHPMVRFIPLR
jgi:hypothetical protein